jgi:hypothetical protein
MTNLREIHEARQIREVEKCEPISLHEIPIPDEGPDRFPTGPLPSLRAPTIDDHREPSRLRKFGQL